MQRLVNRGSTPVTRHIAQVDLERVPSDGERSSFRRDVPSIWEQLQFEASLGADDRELIKWVPPRSGGVAFDEILLLFETADVPIPLYPAQRTTVAYTYRLPERRQDSWFERDIRTPTWRLRVRLSFPAAVQPSVWGMLTSLAREEPLPEPVRRPAEDTDRVEFEWRLENPMLLTHFRFGWTFQQSTAEPPGHHP